MKVIFTCGGTGGHIYPAIAVAKLLQERHPDCEILFIGAEDGMENRIVPREGEADLHSMIKAGRGVAAGPHRVRRAWAKASWIISGIGSKDMTICSRKHGRRFVGVFF